MTSAISLKDRQRTKILAFLRTCQGIDVGQPEKPIRFLAAMLWLMRRGAQWQRVPERDGKGNSIDKR